jgi:hypothetical protein
LEHTDNGDDGRQPDIVFGFGADHDCVSGRAKFPGQALQRSADSALPGRLLACPLTNSFLALQSIDVFDERELWLQMRAVQVTTQPYTLSGKFKVPKLLREQRRSTMPSWVRRFALDSCNGVHSMWGATGRAMSAPLSSAVCKALEDSRWAGVSQP